MDGSENSEYLRGMIELIMRTTWHEANDGEDPGDGMLYSALEARLTGEQVYTKCEDCHLFVEPNSDDEGVADYGLAPYVHLHRGTPDDEALDATHNARPGEAASLDFWKKYGPYAMRARFDTA